MEVEPPKYFKSLYISLSLNITILTIIHIYKDLSQAEYSTSLITDIVFNFIFLIILFISLLTAKFGFLIIIPYITDFFFIIIITFCAAFSYSSLYIDDGLKGVNYSFTIFRIILIIIKFKGNCFIYIEEFDP